MQYYQIVTSLLGAAFFFLVVRLVRKDAILIGAAIRWLLIAILTLVLGFYPELSDVLASYIGIAYPPILPIILVCLLLLIKALIADIERAKTQVKLDRLAQKLAIVEEKLNTSEKA